MANSINVDKLHKICLDFTNYLESCKALFSNIDLEMANVDSNLSSFCKKDIAKVYMSIKDNYDVIEFNIVSFIDDLRNVINGKEQLDIELSESIVRDIEKLDDGRNF